MERRLDHGKSNAFFYFVFFCAFVIKGVRTAYDVFFDMGLNGHGTCVVYKYIA
jgi:hypothetical protein